MPYNDLLKAGVSLASAEQSRAEAAAKVKNAKSALNTIIGNTSDKPIEIEILKEPKNSAFKPEQLKSESLQKRPEIQLLKMRIKNIEYSKKLEKSFYYPQVSFFAQYEQNGENIKACDNDHKNAHNSKAGIMAEWTLFDFKKRSNAVSAVEFQKKSAMENLKNIQKNITLDVETSLRNLNVAEKNIKTAAKSIEQAKENFRITNLQYREQTTTSTEVLNARTYLTSAKTDYYKALYKYWNADADLKRSLGRIL